MGVRKELSIIQDDKGIKIVRKTTEAIFNETGQLIQAYGKIQTKRIIKQ